MRSVCRRAQDIGVLVQRKVIDPGLVDDMISRPILQFWISLVL